MAGLITIEQLEARLGEDLASRAEAEALIEDASALVRQVARTDFATTIPAVVVSVVAQMVRRALDNPGDLVSERLGDYSYQTAANVGGAPAGSSLYVTRDERRIIREAAERPAIVTIAGDTGLADSRWSGSWQSIEATE
jgi:hypothetical protein